jgi:arylsulfatase A-like enzyme
MNKRINRTPALICLILLGLLTANCTVSIEAEKAKPNVILILTDDQGYGDVAAHGNPLIKTPNMDKLHNESMRFTNFHVATTCSPTRSGVMTGRYCNAVGVWHTILSRSNLRKDETTIADIFSNAGYETAMFGKWHLGDNYPYRPQDRGFKTTVIHGAGGVGQIADHWNNDYFDDTYFRNGNPEKFEGYCTDIWFQEATKFVEKNTDKPFFCYISTNAPHGPFHVDSTYIKPYMGIEQIKNPNFYGMITNIDDNIGKLEARLQELNLADNTILVFMTDNGTSAGRQNGYNAGMRGQKGSEYEGGHRVPFFIRWKDGKVSGGKDITKITGYTDILPTLADLCEIEIPSELELHGKSLKPLLENTADIWEDRTLFADTQRAFHLEKYKRFSVMTDQWRLVNETELYDMTTDPGQETDVAAAHPDVVENLMQEYEGWWNEVSLKSDEFSAISIAPSKIGITRLTSMDINTKGGVPWNQNQVRFGQVGNGYYMLDFEETGTYAINMYRYPEESRLGLHDEAPIGHPVDGGKPYVKGAKLDIINAGLELNGSLYGNSVNSNAQYASVKIDIKEKGEYKLEAWFELADGTKMVPYFMHIERLN